MKTDYGLDREIQSILSVDPSPEFTAKVRRCIENAPAPAWRFEWMIVAVTAMAAGIAIAIVMTRVPHESLRASLPEPQRETSRRTTSPSDSEVKAVLPVFKSAVPVSKTPTESTERMATTAAKSGEPEFFISAGEAAAIRRLLRTGSVEQVEIAIETIVPQPLPETHMTPISLFEPIPTGPLLPVATPKGDSQ